MTSLAPSPAPVLRRRLALAASLVLASALPFAACDDGGGGGFTESGGGANSGDGGKGSSNQNVGGAGGFHFNPTGGSTSSGAHLPPDADFVDGELGAYALGQEVDENGVIDTGVDSGDGNCNILVGVVRDFQAAASAGGHPDFEAYSGDHQTPGLVEDVIGADKKPVYASECEAGNVTGTCPYGAQTTSKADFDLWYTLAKGINKPYLVYFKFEENGGVSTFQSTAFFPLDGAGWGNAGNDHNFHFTTELHTKFKYTGGETFSFSGDDDLWVFINGRLAIDLGGLHPAEQSTVDLDASAGELGIEVGKVYPLELFHAERHTNASNFRVDTNLAFVDCGTIIPDPS